MRASPLCRRPVRVTDAGGGISAASRAAMAARRSAVACSHAATWSRTPRLPLRTLWGVCVPVPSPSLPRSRSLSLIRATGAGDAPKGSAFPGPQRSAPLSPTSPTSAPPLSPLLSLSPTLCTHTTLTRAVHRTSRPKRPARCWFHPARTCRLQHALLAFFFSLPPTFTSRCCGRV